MRVRLTGKFNAAYGLVQEQTATVVDFVVHADDDTNYRQTSPGELVKHKHMPTGMWLQVDDFKDSPIWGKMTAVVTEEKLARGLYCMPVTEADFSWETSSVKHCVK